MRRVRLGNLLPWVVLAAAVVGTDVAAFRWVIKARSTFLGGVGGGPMSARWCHYFMDDGSVVRVVRNAETGETLERVVIRPATMPGLCRAWWPAVFGAGLTLAPLGFVRRREGSWLIPALRRPRRTTQLWMIVVAVMAVECGLFVENTRRTPARTSPLDAALTAATLVAVQGLFFIPIGVALAVRKRLEPAIDG